MRAMFPASVAVAVALACSTTVVMAQETTSSIRGTVSDGTGEPVPGATVVILHTGSGTTSTMVTSGTGTFSAPGLRPGGPYKVTVTASGHDVVTMDQIFLSVAEPMSLPVLVGEQVLDEVTVAGSKGIELTAGPTTTLDRNSIEGVASVQRDIRDLVRRDPYASFNPSTRGVSIAGTNNRMNRFAVDGVRFSDNFGLQQGGLPTTRGPVPLDAVEQMSVKVAPYDITEGDFQGGSINLVLRSGGNDFTGSAFYAYASDSLTGDKSRGQPITLDFTSKNFGLFFTGPLIQNKLFFALSYEDLDQGDPASVGLIGAPSVVPNLTQDQVNDVAGIASAVYDYDTVGLRTTLPETDKKFTGKLDWNITDNQRLSYTGIIQESYLQSGSTGSSSTSSPTLNYTAYATNEPENVSSHVLQLNSNWGRGISTEARLNYRDYDKIPSSLGEGGFAQFQVCLDPVTTGSFSACTTGQPRLYMGTEQFSQADVVAQKQYGLELVGRYDIGAHSLKAQAAYNALEITNVFVHSSLGLYYFDSLDAFQNQMASQMSWQYSITGDLADVSANFDYEQLTFGVQDSWQVLPTVNFTYGMRLDTYMMDDAPPENQYFVSRYGFSNTNNLDGLSVLQPRIGLTWRATNRLRVGMGYGLFNGGAPDVFIGNSFSVAGVYGNTLSNITRTATGCTLGSALPANICAAALNNVTGRDLRDNEVLFNYLSTNTAALSAAPVNAMQKGFNLPSNWKANLSAEYLADLGPLGDGWNFGADIYKSWVKDAAYYTDLRLTPTGTAPDGRTIYSSITSGNNNDLFMMNTDRGQSTVLVGQVGKSWDFGLGAGFSYTWQNVKSLSDMGTALSGGSTASGTYGAQPAALDVNMPAYGTSTYEIRNSYKLNLDYAKSFFGDYKTRVSLFGELRSGIPYSLMMNSVGSRSLWGSTGSTNRYLLYVPDVSAINADPTVAYSNTATYEAFRDFVVASGLTQGEIISRNSERSPDYFKIDLHAEQEMPAFFGGAKFKAFVDIENLLNMVNNDWGSYRYYDPGSSLVQVTCPTAAGGSCPQYTYSSFTAPSLTTQGRIGLWSARVGFRVEF